jgi:hypothetical protein
MPKVLVDDDEDGLDYIGQGFSSFEPICPPVMNKNRYAQKTV